MTHELSRLVKAMSSVFPTANVLSFYTSSAVPEPSAEGLGTDLAREHIPTRYRSRRPFATLRRASAALRHRVLRSPEAVIRENDKKQRDGRTS